MTNLKPATTSLPHAIGMGLVRAKIKGDVLRLALLERLYSHLLPEAKAQADFAASWLIVEGGTVRDVVPGHDITHCDLSLACEGTRNALA